MDVRAAVMTGQAKTELRSLPRPQTGAEDGLLKIEACGVCEQDAIHYRRGHNAPCILGHEIVGTVAEAGKAALALWGVAVGDRVLLEEYIPCRACVWCERGEFQLCDQAQIDAPEALRYGMTTLDTPPGLWGGFAEMLYLHPHAVLHRIPADIPARLAPLAIPLANGVQWAVIEGGAAPGKTVLVLGGNRHGLGAAMAAKNAGARVILSVTAREAAKLGDAKTFGADTLIDVETAAIVQTVNAATDGKGVDVVVDASPDTSGQVAAGAVILGAKGATLVLGGTGLIPLQMGEIRRKYLTIKPVRGHSFAAVEAALQLLRKTKDVFSPAFFTLDNVHDAIRGDATHRIVTL